MKNQLNQLAHELSRPKEKRFTAEERNAIEIVLDMGLVITNFYGESMTNGGSESYNITDRMNEDREYKTLSGALTQFLK